MITPMLVAEAILRWLVGSLFTLLGIEAARRAIRARNVQPERAALTVAVGLFGLTALLGRVQEATSYRVPAISDISLATFITSAFALLLVRHALVPLSKRTRVVAFSACVTSAVVVLTAHLPARPSIVRPSLPQLLAVLFLFSVWTACVGEPAVRFWRIARHAPRLQGARARALSISFGGIALILDVALIVMPKPRSVEALVLGLFALMLVPMLWIAAVPPRWIRRFWRARGEKELRLGVTALLRMPAREMKEAALDWALRAVGGNGGMITFPDGTILTRNMTDDSATSIAAEARTHVLPTIVRHEDHAAMIVPLNLESGEGLLAVCSGPLTPMFGEDELGLLDSYAAPLTAALDRGQLIDALHRETTRSRVMLEAIGRMDEALLIIEGARVVYANEALERLNGYPLEELRAMSSFLDIVPPEERTVVAERVRRRLSGEAEENHYQTKIRHRDGHIVDVEVSAQILESEGTTQILAICRDVTERTRVDARESRRTHELGAFARAAQRLAGTLDAAALGAAVATSAREVVGAERAAFVTFADGSVERVYSDGLTETDLLRAGALTPHDGYLGRLLAAGRPVRVAQLQRAPSAGGSNARAYSFLAVPVIRSTQMLAVLYLAGKEGAVAFDDIDESVALGLATFATETLGVAQAFERERALVERLKELDQMKNAFMSALSHELRTPLTSVIGFAQTLDGDSDRLLPSDRQAMMHRLIVNAHKLERLLADLLDLDRLQRGILHPAKKQADIARLVLRVLDEFDFGGGRTINVNIAPFEIEIDQPKVERIVENLLANAVKHTNPETPIWVNVERTAGGAMILVEDAGEGVPEDVRGRIFEPFAQGPRIAKHSPGVGIGLSLVARFAELHGGRAWVEDRPGGGASFRVFLPGATTCTDADASVAMPA